jgi:phage shock protein E
MCLYRKLILLVFVMAILLSGCEPKSSGEHTSADQGSVILLSPKELKQFPENVQLIDVRTPGEYQRAHLKNAININMYGQDFLTEINKLDKNREVYLYCQVGSRSRNAAKIFQKQGFTKVYDMDGGISYWRKFNYEIETNKP